MPNYRHVFPTIRWAPDLMMIPALKELTNIPIVYAGRKIGFLGKIICATGTGSKYIVRERKNGTCSRHTSMACVLIELRK